MRRTVSAPVVVLCAVAACLPYPPSDTDVTGTSGGSGGTSTTGQPEACGDGDVAFSDVCLRLYEFPQVTAHFMASGDCDGDSRTDLIIDDASAQAVSVVYVSTTNEITQSNTASRQVPISSEERIFTANFDGQPGTDFAIMRGTALEDFPMVGSNPGPSTVYTFSTPETSERSAAISFMPQEPALLFVGYVSGARLWWRDGAVFLPAEEVYSVPECGYPADLQVADFNGDAIPDVVLVGDDRCGDKDLGGLPLAEGKTLLGAVDLTFGGGAQFQVGTSPITIVTADFNGDSLVDIATLNLASEDVSVLLGNGDGTFVPEVRVSLDERLEAIEHGDLDGDGRSELIILTRGGRLVVVASPHEMQEEIALVEGALQPVVAADFNGDGRDDVAFRTGGASSYVGLLLSDV